MRKIIFAVMIMAMAFSITAFADSEPESTPKPTMTPKEIAMEKGLSDYDWEMLYRWQTNHMNNRFKGLTTKEKYEYFNALKERYFDVENKEYLGDISVSESDSKNSLTFTVSENTLDNGKTFDDTWIYKSFHIYEWNGRVIYDNHISKEKISESNGTYTFNVYTGRIEDAEEGGVHAVDYTASSKILPYQELVIFFDKDSDAKNPSGTVSIIEDGDEIMRCNIIEVNSPTLQSYTYFFDMEKSERESVAYQKENWGSWTENGKRYVYARISKKPKEIASFHFDAEVDGSETAETVSTDDRLTVDYYVLDPKIDSNIKHDVEVLVISGDKGKSVYYKRSGYNISVPTAQSVMLGGEMYVNIPYDKVTTYYENEENRDEYRLEVCGDENAFLTLSFGTYDKPEYKVQLDVDDLHITKTYDEMTAYSENMPEYWHADAEGRFDSSPEGRRLLEEIGQEHTVYYADGRRESFEDNNEYKELKVINTSVGLEINLDAKKVNFPDAQPFIDENDRTQIPIRAVADMLDCSVEWDDKTKTVTITNTNSDIVTLVIDSDIMTVNDKPVQMDTAAIIRDDRTYIPVRFVAEAMGLVVEWKN